VRRHNENAQKVAEWLSKQDAVARVDYPGLPSHEGHTLAARQQRGFGGMISFELKGNEATVRGFVENLNFFSLAESLGGIESLVCHPATMTHAPLSPAALAEAGISSTLVRVSVGLESAEDLVTDVLSALDVAARTPVMEQVALAV